MELTRISEAAGRFGLSSRTLRYYEQVGLLWSARPPDKAQRYYDGAALERLKQLVVLRKLQIPIKDIVKIYGNDGTASLTEAFARKLEALDMEIASLTELRRLVDDFLRKLVSSGIRKISAVPLLYEETEKRLAPAVRDRPVTFGELSGVSRSALRLQDARIIRLPAMRVLTSRLKSGGTAALDADSMENLFSEYGVLPDDVFAGGLFAVAGSRMETMDDTFPLLREWVCKSGDYAYDAGGSEAAGREEMIEETMPWDISRRQNTYQQDIFIPVREMREGEDSK
jgi:DNA-binding transcriptional MerR regulator